MYMKYMRIPSTARLQDAKAQPLGYLPALRAAMRMRNAFSLIKPPASA